jgi:hypothetical protein
LCPPERRTGGDVLQYVFRYSVKPGMAGEFNQWLLDNHEGLRDHLPDGWHYLGTWFSVRGFGAHDCEVRYELDDYAAPGEGFGDEVSVGLLKEFFEKYQDSARPTEAYLLRAAGDVDILG